MKSIEKYISPLIKSQFPDFYKEQGPLFVLFVEEYYKWLESNDSDYSTYAGAVETGNPLYHARRLLDYRDIDSTVDGFYVYFKEKYLKGVQFNPNISKARLIKASHDLLAAKGSERSLNLFFNLLYGTKIELYYPGDDILKASDGTWVTPRYLELTRSQRTLTYPGKLVTGSISGATAFVEYVITRNINGKLIDIVFLSNVTGEFSTGETIADTDSIADAPKIVGSLTSVAITSGGELFSEGEIVNLTSASGVEGVARVTGVDSVTGIVRFTIVNGGWGYSTTAQTTVAEKMMRVSSITNSNSSITEFIRNETISQNLVSFTLNNVIGNIQEESYFRNGDNSTPSLSVTPSVTQNTVSVAAGNSAVIILNQLSSNVYSNTILYEVNRALIVTNTAITLAVGDPVVQYNGSSNNNSGVVSQVSNTIVLTVNTASIGSNGIHVGTYIEQSTTGATGYVQMIPRENLFTYTNVSHIAVASANGTFNNTSTITAYTNAAKTTTLTTFDPTKSESGHIYLLIDTNLSSTTRWATSNTVINSDYPVINTSIIFASDIGGKVATSTDITATANVFAQNTSTIGLVSVGNTFYATTKTQIVGLSSNTVANTETIYTGQNADFNIGILTNSETVLLASDLISSNNDGPSTNSVKYRDMVITGANSTYGYINDVYVQVGGTGYNNTNIVTFSGGNTGVGSFGVANATLTTNATGGIITVTLSANTGNGIVTTPAVSVVNSSGGSTGVGTNASLIPVAPLGFPKFVLGNITTPLISLLDFESKTIGTITTLTGINPGEDYNIGPFVLAYEPKVASYGKRDIVLEHNITSGPGFVVGEYVDQTINTASLSITSNNYSGNTTPAYEVNEIVYSTDGISNVAAGVVYSHVLDVPSNTHTTVITGNTGLWQNTILVTSLSVGSNTYFEPGNKIIAGTANGILVTSNSSTLIVKNVQGTFAPGVVASNASPTPGAEIITAATNTYIYTLKGVTTNSNSHITNTAAYTASSRARAIVKTTSNTYSTLQRVSLFTDYVPGGEVSGVTSGTVANVITVTPDASSNIVGDNSVITANVVSSVGTLTSIEVTDSGFGFENNESINIVSLDGTNAALGKANVATKGIGSGYYSSTRGFLDNNKYLIDGEYYQNYSYEIQTNISLDMYFDTLKQLLHVSGKKLFGRVVISPSANLSITGTTSIEIS